jgi:hypothetical protein
VAPRSSVTPACDLGVRVADRLLNQDAAEDGLAGREERLLGEARVLLVEDLDVALAEILDRPAPPVELLEVSP